MNHFLVLLFFLLGGIWCDHRLSPGENMYLKSYCGTKPYLPSLEGNQSLKASCGTKSYLSRRFESRSIAGGEPIQGNEAPWAAKIQYPKISCSSTIISQRHIMSASHCLMSNTTQFYPWFDRMRRECSGNDLIYYPESSELTVRNSNGKLLSDKVSKIIMMNFCKHPNARYDDMMIWELSENIPFDDYAWPACISSNPNLQAMNTVVKATAYGHDNWDTRNMNGQGTRMLRSGCFQITDSKGRRYNKLWLIADGKSWRVQARPGDSGGSLMHYVNGQFYVIGVISHGLIAEPNQTYRARKNIKAWKLPAEPNRPKRFESESIAGGTPIPGNEAPWAAKIQYPGSSCSSTIISSRHILSASHCLMSNVTHYAHRFNRIRNECSGNDLIFYPNSSKFVVKNSNGTLLSNKVSKIIMLNYCVQADFRYDDMMIWELSENIQLDDYAFPACISSNPNLQAMNTVVKATAYGHDNWDMRNTNGQGTSMLRSGCFQITESRDRSYDEFWFIVDGKRWRVEARKGDSGGSLIHYANTQFHLIGVISHSWDTSMLAASSVSAHYTRICHHTGIC